MANAMIFEGADFHLRGSRRDAVMRALGGVKVEAANLGGRIDLALVAGDTAHQPQVGDAIAPTGTLLCDLMEWRDGLHAEFGTRFIFVEGQHDSTTQGRSAVAPLANEFTDVVAMPSVLEPVAGIVVLCLPYLYPGHLLSDPRHRDCNAEELGRAFRGYIQDVLDGFTATAQQAHAEGKLVIFCGHLRVAGTVLPGSLMIKDDDRELVVTAEQLLGVGADRYVFGDLHVYEQLTGEPQRGGYVSTLVEDGFAEGQVVGVYDKSARRSSQAGYNLVEFTNEGRIARVHRIETLPQHTTTTIEKAKELCREGRRLGTADYPVRIRDHWPMSAETIKAMGMDPSFVTFEAIPAKTERRRRAEGIEATQNPHELFRRWLDANPTNVETHLGVLNDEQQTQLDVLLTEFVRQARERGAAPESRHGSLQSIDRIGCTNIVPHETLDLDFSTVEGIIGFAGENGSGKTMAIELVPMTLFGKSPSGRALPDLVMETPGEGRMMVEFTSDGRRYRAIRILKVKAAGWTQDVYLHELANDDAKSTLLAGPKQAEFNEEVERLLGSEESFLSMAFSAQDAAGDITALPPSMRKRVLQTLIGADWLSAVGDVAKERLATLLHEMGLLVDRATSLGEAVKDGERAAEKLAELKVKETADAADVAATQAELEQAGSFDAQIAEKDRLIGEAHRNRDAATKRNSEIEHLLWKQSTAAARIAELDTLAARKDEVATTLKWWQDQEAAARAAQEKLNAQYGNEREAANLYEAARRAELSTRAQNEKAMAEATSKVAEWEREAALLNDPELNCPVDTPRCKFTVSAQKARERLDSQEFRDAMAASEKQVMERNSAAAAATTTALKAMETQRGITRKLESELAAHNATGISEHLRTAQAERASIESAEAETASLRAATLDGAELHREQADLSKTTEACSAEMVRLRNERTSIADAAGTLKTVGIYKALLAGMTANLQKLHEEIGATKQQVAAGATAKSAIADLNTDLSEKGAVRGKMTLLQDAFSTNGIPQLLIEAAAEQLEEAANETANALGLTAQIKVETLATTKAGTARESLNILIVENGEERDIATFSGGERKLWRFVIRAAMLRFQSQRAGRRIEVIMMDETFDALDDANRDRVIAAVYELSGDYHQVFVVTHAVMVISQLRTRVYFRKQGGKSIVEMNR